jgi:hypothetical protein
VDEGLAALIRVALALLAFPALANCLGAEGMRPARLVPGVRAARLGQLVARVVGGAGRAARMRSRARGQQRS